MAIKAYDKFNILQEVFNEKTKNGTINIGKDISFTLSDISEAFDKTGGKKPTSHSNFVLDLTRKNRGIHTRLPEGIYKYGYDLRKKTGIVPSKVNTKYCGEFIFTGKDKTGKTIELQDWLVWTKATKTIMVKNQIPDIVLPHLSNDEAALFSVMDYCDILTQAISPMVKIYRVQNPMKWQPNEIDGFYVSAVDDQLTVYPVEAKAQSTKDDINLVQMYGQYITLVNKFKGHKSAIIRPIAAKMTGHGMLIAKLECNPLFDSEKNKTAPMFHIHDIMDVKLDRKIPKW